MRLLDRYIGREVASHALLGLAVFTFVFFVPQLVRLMDLIVRHSGGAVTVALLFRVPLPPDSDLHGSHGRPGWRTHRPRATFFRQRNRGPARLGHKSAKVNGSRRIRRRF